MATGSALPQQVRINVKSVYNYTRIRLHYDIIVSTFFNFGNTLAYVVVVFRQKSEWYPRWQLLTYLASCGNVMIYHEFGKYNRVSKHSLIIDWINLKLVTFIIWFFGFLIFWFGFDFLIWFWFNKKLEMLVKLTKNLNCERFSVIT